MNKGYAEQFPDGMDEFTQNMISELEKPKTFYEELRSLINRHSRENESNTPDFILAEYMQECLASFEKASRAREKWYGKELKIGME